MIYGFKNVVGFWCGRLDVTLSSVTIKKHAQENRRGDGGIGRRSGLKIRR
jgi:hypothetical protein